MKNENALYTVSMLSAMLEDGTGNYLDLLTPFVLYSLPKTIDSPISIDAVTEAMREFGFKDFPYKTSEKILNRLCKASGDDPVYVRATSANKKRKYWVSAVYNASDFTTRRTEMRRKIDGILKAMQEYFNTHFYYMLIFPNYSIYNTNLEITIPMLCIINKFNILEANKLLVASTIPSSFSSL